MGSIQSFGLWDKHITTWCRQISFDEDVAKLKETYQPVFDNSSPGLCTKNKVHIQLLPDAAILEIEAELQRLENARIISPLWIQSMLHQP